MSNQSVLCLGWVHGYTSAPGSFLFSLRNNDDLGPFKAPLKNENDTHAIYRYNSLGPRFGNEFHISGKSGQFRGSSWAHIGERYQAPPGYTHGKPNTDSLLSGGKRFTPSEIEVLYLN